MATTVTPSRRKSGAPRQVVFSFDEGAPETRTAAVRGGKGAYLTEMTALGLPVPPGFTVTTTVARAFYQHGRVPNRVSDQFIRALKRLEQQTGKEFGNPDNPLLVSVRSGAQASMPGMMDTVLNVGLNPSTVAGLARLQGEQFALDAYCRFLTQFGAVVLGVSPDRLEYVIRSTKAHAKENAGELSLETLGKTCERLRLAIEFDTMQPVPDDPEVQLELSVSAVMRSWTSERAHAYRRANTLPDWWGTAATIQAMVFGNLSDASGAGVVFSHDVATGQPGLYGEFLPKAQGEDVVAGTHQPLPISAMATWNPAAYEDLERLVHVLTDHIGDIVDVEFTVEDGELYLLQVRRAKRTALAAVTYAVHQVWAARMSREEAVRVAYADVQRLQHTTFASDTTHHEMLLKGLPASPGAAVGCVATSSAEAQEKAAQGEKVILVTRDTTPDDLPGMLCAQAIITGNGGATCHAAVVAREQGIPAVVGVGETMLSQLTGDQLVSVDGTAGVVYDGALPLTDVANTKEVSLLLRWVRLYGYTSKLNFDWLAKKESANRRLNDFYLSEAMAIKALGTPLEDTARELRTTIHQETAELFATYLLVAVGGEIRYAFTQTYGMNLPELTLLQQRFGAAAYGPGERQQAQQGVLDALKNTFVTDQAEFFRLCMEVFDFDNWVNPSIGGKAWGKIARAGYDYLRGALTPTQFVDHVFDLRHNGGQLFDKHSMLSACTDERRLQTQLEYKKRADLVRLYRNASLYHGLSTEVSTLYARLQAQA